ncbi:MAG: thiol-disulfide isomerase [Bacteroidetes bacterium]|nr:thiol-disulfide isomerase [Bacteroidota bacterium]
MVRNTNKIKGFYRNIFISIFFIFYTNNLVGQTNQLIIFTGSDWCLPCMRLDKSILNDSLFIQFSSHSLTFIHADFPQKKKLSADVIFRNEKLASLYNPEGIFPFIVVVQNGLPTQIPFHDQSAKELIASIQHILQGYE